MIVTNTITHNYTQSGIPLREGGIVRTELELLCNGNIFLLPINKAFVHTHLPIRAAYSHL